MPISDGAKLMNKLHDFPQGRTKQNRNKNKPVKHAREDTLAWFVPISFPGGFQGAALPVRTAKGEG